MVERITRAWPVAWLLIVAVDVVTGVTTTSPGPGMTVMGALMFFLLMAYRFLVPGLILAPAPMLPICAVGMVLVAGRAGSLDEPLLSGLGDPSAWIGLVLAVGAIVLTLIAPFTGVREEVSSPMLFPLRDGRWLAAEGDGRILNHHWPVPEQRGAWDLVRLGTRQRSRKGFRAVPDSAYFAFGAPVVAPCEGTVVRSVDGLPDGVADTDRPAGNHVVIDTGRELVVLAHLRHGSVAVSQGMTVAPGDPIGEVGNSGNSTEPHLHIHAERDGRPLRLRFTDIRRRVGKGAVVAV
ncbi:MAG: M23 family metallopeptidase [Gordonia paraffinivorans]